MHSKHWLRTTLPNNADAQRLAEQIENSDERIANLKEQIKAVQQRRGELEQNARSLCAELSIGEESVAAEARRGEHALLVSVSESAGLLQNELRRLFVVANPFLSELAQPDLERAISIQSNAKRWFSLCHEPTPNIINE